MTDIQILQDQLAREKEIYSVLLKKLGLTASVADQCRKSSDKIASIERQIEYLKDTIKSVQNTRNDYYID